MLNSRCFPSRRCIGAALAGRRGAIADIGFQNCGIDADTDTEIAIRVTEVMLSLDHPCPAATADTSDDSFCRLLYRYLWPFPYFRDVTCGQKMERQQNYRHNRSLRVHLPGFALKWGVLTALCFSVGIMLGAMPTLSVLTACFVAAGIWTLVVCMTIITAWCWLTRFPELY